MKLKKLGQSTSLAAGAVALTAAAAAAQDTGYDKWQWGAELYFWGASLGGETTTGGDIDVGIDQLVKNLNMGAMATIAGSNGTWSAFSDMIYLDVGKSDTVKASVSGIPIKLDASVDLRGFISTTGVGYRVYEIPGASLDVVGGARVLWLDGKASAKIPSVAKVSGETSGSNWDAIVGVRGRADINEKSYLTYFADIGAGDSDSTWQAAVAYNYKLEKMDLTIGYRYLDWELDNYGPFNDLNLSGVFAGVKFGF